MSRSVLSDAGTMIALLCSRVALPKQGGPDPLTPSEWNDLAPKLPSPDFQPLAGADAATIASVLDVPSALAERLAQLLARAGQFAIEIERLTSRGIWLVTRDDPQYPCVLLEKLQKKAPVFLFGAGTPELLARGGVAVVGSRDASEAALSWARRLGAVCASDSMPLISGAARGIDRAAMAAALESGGTAVGVLAESLEAAIREPQTRQMIADGRLTLITPYHLDAPFSIGAAMGRNKLVYALADCAVVLSVANGTGGTWNGAVENLRYRWTPTLVRDAGETAAAAAALARQGAVLFDDATEFESISEIKRRLQHVGSSSGPAEQDLLQQYWPKLRQILATPRSQKEIASALQIRSSEAKPVLAEALKSGLIERTKKPVRYRLVASAPTPSLFP